jgi:hypothetical protein
MATEFETMRRLRDFFADSFQATELEMFLTLNGYAEVASAVNSNVGSSQYFFNVAQALERRGLIDDAFYQCLIRERPAKESRIRALQESRPEEGKTGSTAPTRPITPTPNPTAPIDRKALVRTISGFAPSDMATFVALIEGAARHISRHGTVPEQAAELIRWAESSTGPGLAAIQKALDDFLRAR